MCTFVGEPSGLYKSESSLWEAPPGIPQQLWNERGWMISVTSVVLLQPLALIRNGVLASTKEICVKRIFVILCAASIALSSLVGGLIEAVIRLAIGIVLIWAIGFQNGLGKSARQALRSGEEAIFGTMGCGLQLAWESLTYRGNVYVDWYTDEHCQALWTVRAMKWCGY